MSSIRMKFAGFLSMSLLGVILSASAALAADKPQTFTGKVSDAMCGANHMMAGEAADCVRTCIRKGSRYALVVGDKVYALDSSDQATLDQLDKLADQPAKVTGAANGDVITVSSVTKAK